MNVVSGHRKTLLRVGLGVVIAFALGIVAIAFAGGGSSDKGFKGEAGNGQAGNMANAKVKAAAQLRKAKSKRGFKPRPARLQKKGSLKRIKPQPKGKYSRGDRGAIWDRGCMLQPPERKAKPCVFGRKKSKKNVVLFGDSHAMHLFGAAERLAKRRGWRLIAQTKAGCGPNTTAVYNNKVDGVFRQCQAWHKGALKRIEKAKPEIIIVGTALSYKPMLNGKFIANERQQKTVMREGYAEMLERLAGTGARIVGVRDLPMAPQDQTDCVAANLRNLKRCAFPKPKRYGRTWEARAARSVEGVQEVDISRSMCTKRRCFGVVRNRLVFRDNDHMTATFSRGAVAPWLARALDRG